MHFLCLHGIGTNSQIFEMQTAALRYELGDHHTYDFVEGVVPWPAAPGISKFSSPSDPDYFAYFPITYCSSTSQASTSSSLPAVAPSPHPDAAGMALALQHLQTYFATSEPPIDAILAFSQGSALAAMLLIQHFRHTPTKPCPFKCAIFIAGVAPWDPDLLGEGRVEFVDAETEAIRINIPTMHVWDVEENSGKLNKRNGSDVPTAQRERDLEVGVREEDVDVRQWGMGLSKSLFDLCEDETRRLVTHSEGHEVPRKKDSVVEAVRSIRWTVDRALSLQ